MSIAITPRQLVVFIFQILPLQTGRGFFAHILNCLLEMHFFCSNLCIFLCYLGPEQARQTLKIHCQSWAHLKDGIWRYSILYDFTTGQHRGENCGHHLPAAMSRLHIPFRVERATQSALVMWDRQEQYRVLCVRQILFKILVIIILWACMCLCVCLYM